MQEVEAGFVRFTHRRCEDCEIREDLHASGAAIPQRRFRIARCQTCGGRGEIPNDHKSGLDPYRSKDKPGKPQLYEKRRALRAYSERHRFRPKTFLFDICELVMQIPPGGFNHGRTRTEDGEWRPLESQGSDGDVIWNPSFKHQNLPLKHGTRYSYEKGKCRCLLCRAWRRNYDRGRRTTPIYEAENHVASANAGGAFPQQEIGTVAA